MHVYGDSVMSKAGRQLQIGDMCETSFSGKVTQHKIVRRMDGSKSQSGVMFVVEPTVPKSGGGWFDADWFEPLNNKK